jgi:PGF-CTERM protein
MPNIRHLVAVVLLVSTGGLIFATAPVAADWHTPPHVSVSESIQDESSMPIDTGTNQLSSDSVATESTSSLIINVSNRSGSDVSFAKVVLWAGDYDTKVGTKRTNSNGEASWGSLESGTYTVEVYQPDSGDFWGSKQVELSPGGAERIDFSPSTPYIDNFGLDEPYAPLDNPNELARGPRFNYQPGETTTLRAVVHDPESGFFTRESVPVAVQFDIDRANDSTNIASIWVNDTLSDGETAEFTTDWEVPGTTGEFEVHASVYAEYSSAAVPTYTDKLVNVLWSREHMHSIADENWAYDGDGIGSLNGAYLADQGLDGSDIEIGIIGEGLDESNPVVNFVEETGTHIPGQFNVHHTYNPYLGSDVQDDPSSEGYHGWQVASAVWQFAPNATYYVTKSTGLSETQNTIKAISHLREKHNPDIIVYSRGTEGGTAPEFRGEFNRTADADTVVVVSAGNLNQGFNYTSSPAIAPDVYAISSTTQGAHICRGSSPGNSTLRFDKPEFTAPGCDVPVLGDSGPNTDGSSFAAPFTAGAIAQLTQFARRNGETIQRVTETLSEVAIPTKDWNGTVDEDNNGSTFDDDLDGEGRIMPVGAYHELLADDHIPGTDVTIEQVDADATSVTFNVRLNETRGAGVHSGGIHLAATGGGSFEAIDLGDFHSVENITRGGINVVELYASAGNVTSGNITLNVPDGASTDVAVRGWLYDQHDAVYNPYLGRYDRYVARYPAENRSADGDNYAEGERWDRSTSNPPFNRHLGDPEFDSTDYSTIEMRLMSENGTDRKGQPTGFVDVDPADLPGSGTPEDPYIISNASELQAIDDDRRAIYRLGSDIDASGTAGWNDGAGFDPIGGFTGELDGAGHAISGLTINRSQTDEVGFFAGIGGSGQVHDVSLLNVSVTGSDRVGGLVGLNVEGGVVENVSANGTISGSSLVGGLVGYNVEGGVVRNASAGGAVAGSEAVGGLIGANDDGGVVRNASASGLVNASAAVGGLIGANAGGRIIHTFATGPVNGSDDVGGLIGDNGGPVEDSYWDLNTTGQATSEGGIGLTTAQMTGQAARDNMTGFAFGTAWETRPSDYPALTVLSGEDEITNGTGTDSMFVDLNPADLPGSGTEADPYIISNSSELQAMDDDLDAVYRLEGDIDASGTADWNDGSGFDPIGGSLNNAFTGEFDGAGHAISGLTINRSQTGGIGLFGFIGSSGQVHDVSLVNASITGGELVGGIAGLNAEGTVRRVSASGRVTGDSNTGGLVGSHFDGGTVENASASVTVTGFNRVGGLIGFNSGTVRGAFASGRVTGSADVGGLVGLSGGTVEDSYWDLDTTEQATSDGGTGLTTAQMTGQAARDNMTGFAFGIVWETRPGDYPAVIPSSSERDSGTDTDGEFVDVNPADLPGSGTEADPYIITNTSELQAMDDDLDAVYRLGGDIDASGTADWNDGAGFDPIGTDSNRFVGEFNGAGHTISGLRIDRSETDGVGLFGHVGDTGRTHNVSLVNVSAAGFRWVGALVGRNFGTVRDASASSSVTGESDVGGLVGSNFGTVRDASASSAADGSFLVGGLIGVNGNGGTVRDASASGTVTGSENGVGGLVGLNGGTIRNVSASGTVAGELYVGGLVGVNDAASSSFGSDGIVQESFASSNVTGENYVGGLIGRNSGMVSNSHYNVSGVLINGERKITLGALFEEQFQDWKTNKQLNLSEYDSLNQTDSGVEITTVQGVKDALGFTQDPSLDWTLGEDIDLSGEDIDLYIPSLAGNLDGNGHTLTVDIDNPTVSPIGAIGYNPSGKITNLSVTGAVTGSDNVGGLVGLNGGTVGNASASVIVTGSDGVGGLIGFNSGTVRETFASGTVTGSEDVGGLVGTNGEEGTVQDSYYDLNATGQATSAGGTGLTTAQMTGEAARTNMSGLAFDTVWTTQSGDYPGLIEKSDSNTPDRTTTPGDTETKTEPESPGPTPTPGDTETETSGKTTAPTDTETSSSGQPGFTVGLAVIALLVVLGLRRRR